MKNRWLGLGLVVLAIGALYSLMQEFGKTSAQEARSAVARASAQEARSAVARASAQEARSAVARASASDFSTASPVSQSASTGGDHASKDPSGADAHASSAAPSINALPGPSLAVQLDAKMLEDLRLKLANPTQIVEYDFGLCGTLADCGKRSRFNIDAIIARFRELPIASDTPEVRRSVLFTHGVTEQLCQLIGVEKAVALSKELSGRAISRKFDQWSLWEDMLYGVNIDSAQRRLERVDFSTATRMLFYHESPNAVAMALGALAGDSKVNTRLEGAEFFRAGNAVGSIADRVALLPAVGALYRCKVSANQCLPDSLYTVIQCRMSFTCGADRDPRAIVALRHSAVQMQAIEAMTEALHQERLRVRGKLTKVVELHWQIGCLLAAKCCDTVGRWCSKTSTSTAHEPISLACGAG